MLKWLLTPVFDILSGIFLVLFFVIQFLAKALSFGKFKLGIEHIPTTSATIVPPQDACSVVKVYDVEGKVKFVVPVSFAQPVEQLLNSKGLDWNAQSLMMAHSFIWVENVIKDYLRKEAWKND